MPLKKNINKQKQVAQKKEITMRLMAITLKVDKYIYKNKQITITEAQMYLEELLIFRSLCSGDAPSLQVCEKLTRCMRGIIEEQRSNDAVLEDTDTFIDLNHPSNMNAPSPVYSLPDIDKTYMESQIIREFYPENKKSTLINIYNDRIEESNDVPRKSVRFCIDDQIEHNNMLTEPVNVTPEIAENADFDKYNPRNDNTNRHYNVDDELSDVIVDLTLKDIEQPITIDEDLCSQSILKNIDTNETTTTIADYCINDTCGQDIAEFDREIINLIDNETEGNKEYNIGPETTTITQITSKTTKKMPVIVKTAETANKRTMIPNIHETKRLLRNKLLQGVKVQKKSITKKKNKENKPQTKRRKNKPNTLVFTPLTNRSNATLQASSNIYSETNNASKITQNASKKNIEMRYHPNIVQPTDINSSNIVQNSVPNINKKQSSNIVCLEEDLSWVEKLTYAREIHLEEYDSTFKPYSESFWDNCELPDNWDGRDFEWT